MSVLLKIAIGLVVGSIVGLVIERVVARPLVQSMVALPLGWLLASLAMAAIWIMQPLPDGADVRAISGGVAESALFLLVILVMGVAAHAVLGWAGSKLHPVLADHRAVVMAVVGGVCGAMGFTVLRGPVA